MGSKDDALDAEEEKKLREYIFTNGTPVDKLIYYGMACWGLRVSEFAHFREPWLDKTRGLVRIPSKQGCDCWECRSKRGGFWYPKTEAGIRVIPAKKISPEGWDYFVTYFMEGGRPPTNRKRVWARVVQLFKLAGIGHEGYPHALRATAAMKISSWPRVTASVLMSVMGWSRIETANQYIKASGIEVERAFEGDV